MSWNQPLRVAIPWMKTLSGLLGRVALPTIQDRSLWVMSDYCYDNRASDFDVIGLLIASPAGLSDWLFLRNEIRARVLIDQRTMSWKKLNSDSRRQAAFFPFLRAADHIPGLAIALACHRDPAFQIPSNDLGRFYDSFQLSAKW